MPNFDLNISGMINSFIVKAVPEKNQLKVILDGFFMKSEVELAMHLAKRESKKLKKGYNVLIDITKFHSSEKVFSGNYGRIQHLLKMMGSGDLKFIGMNYNILAETNYANVGFYPYENEWFF
jgi:hypothetical protein